MSVYMSSLPITSLAIPLSAIFLAVSLLAIAELLRTLNLISDDNSSRKLILFKFGIIASMFLLTINWILTYKDYFNFIFPWIIAFILVAVLVKIEVVRRFGERHSFIFFLAYLLIVTLIDGFFSPYIESWINSLN